VIIHEEIPDFWVLLDNMNFEFDVNVNVDVPRENNLCIEN
jgi:hypothetical protein